MFGLNESMHYYLCTRCVDMRNGINGLSKIVRNEMGLAPLGGGIFVFFSKNRQSVKILRWDSDGFILYHKRLERGTFEMPSINVSTGRAEVPWRTFSLIMQGISTKSVRYRRRMRIDV